MKKNQTSNYDETLDETHFVAGKIEINSYSWYQVSVRSYDNGPLKIAIEKRGTRTDGTTWMTTNLSRLDADTAAAISDLLIEAADWIDEHNAVGESQMQGSSGKVFQSAQAS